MKATIIAHTTEPLKTLFIAIRTCYSPFNQEQVAASEYSKYLAKFHETYGNDAMRLIAQVAKLGHLSTLEHVSFTFAIEGISRALLAQLTRHRIGFSYSVQSQRYVDFKSESKSGGMESIEPHSISMNPSAHQLFTQTMRELQHTYDVLRGLGIPSEDARYILPNAATTNVTLTCNLRSFIDFYSKRSSTHAQ
jgi:thymidylate synthase (FAD)